MHPNMFNSISSSFNRFKLNLLYFILSRTINLNIVLTLNFCKFMTLNLTIHDTNFKIILKNVSDMTKYKF